MDPKLLTENGWKTLVQMFKLKDNGLQRALAVYEKLPDIKLAERLTALDSVRALAGKLMKASDVALIPRAANYLTDVVDASEAERKQVEAAVAKAGAHAKKQDAKEQQKTEKQEELYNVRLMAAFQKLKSAKDLSFEFIVCDAKPHCGLMVANRITPQHKDELTRLTGGSKRFLQPGTCRFADGKFTFTMDQPVSGLAKKLQDSIKNSTGKKLPVVVGAESAEADE